MVHLVLIGGTRLHRDGLRILLEESGSEIVGAYASTEDVQPREPGAEPVVYLLMPSGGHRRIREEIDDLRHVDADSRITVMLSRLAADALVEVFAAGGDGLVLEEISAQALHDSLRLVASGEKVFPSQLTMLLKNERWAEPMQPQGLLTKREREIVRCLALGMSNKEIAIEFALALATIKVHVKSLLRKLGLSNRTQAAIWALNAGLVDPPEMTLKADDGARPRSLPLREPESRTNEEDFDTAQLRTRSVQDGHVSRLQEDLNALRSKHLGGSQKPNNRPDRRVTSGATSPRPFSVPTATNRETD